MEDLTKILNQRISQKIANNQPSPDQLGQQMKFDELLQSKKSDNTSDLIHSLIGKEKVDLQVQPMDHINVNLADVESSSTHNKNGIFQKGFDIFSQLNDNHNSLSMAVEVLSDPNTKLSRQQLLAYQAGLGNLTLNSEIMSKLMQSGVKAVQRFTEMQI